MFEDFFKNEIKDKENKIKQETRNATLEYTKVKESNPFMLSQNNMDLSNSPLNNNTSLGYYNNPYLNPNLIPPPPQFSSYQNPYIYRSQTFNSGTWYGSYYNNFNDYTSNFMIASDEEIRNGKNTRGRVITEEESTIDVPQEHIPYSDKSSGKYLEVNVEIEEIDENKKNDNKIYEIDGVKYREEKLDISKHPPHTPFTMDELRQNTIRVLVNNPLIWTEEDENELDKLVDMIAVYDKALAHVLWNIPCNIDSISREEYNYCKIYCRNLIQEYQSEEILHREIDFRAPYRYRKTPEVNVDDNGNEIVDMSKPHLYAKRIISKYSYIEGYEYDRGRDELTENEWNLFIDRAYLELMNGIKSLQGQDLFKINKPILEKTTNYNSQDTNNNVNFNPYDPISVKLYNMKQSEKGYNTNMEFFRYALRHKFTSNEQFDNWWYGTQSQAEFVRNRNNPEFYRNYQESSWKRQMTEQNVANLSKFVPLDHNLIAQQYNQRAQQEIEKFTKGNLNSNMSMAEVVNNLPYLDNRIHEMTVEQNFNNYKNSLVYNNGQSIINKNMFNHMLYEFHNNDNPNYSSPYGPTIDPRMGVPNIIKDYTQADQQSYQERLNRFLDACKQMQEFPLNSAGGLK